MYNYLKLSDKNILKIVNGKLELLKTQNYKSWNHFIKKTLNYHMEKSLNSCK